MMRAVFLALLTILLLPVAALAQATDRPNTILVLDGSGSMWGQIDGVNKIVIARNVIADLLADMADDVSLGLTVYGHRERGSCGDIQTIVEPAPGTQDRILEAVNAINPRGRTPMADAVIAAAQSLRHTEEAATVILVSDGIENCNPDPCAIATELEQSGVAFTAHVIGFDVAGEPEARAQMQCIADNTGGQFLTADNAAELSAALEQVVAAAPTPMRIEAQVLPQGDAPTRPVTWTLLDAAGATLSQGTPGPAIDVQLMPGTYTVQATRTEPDGPETYQTAFTVVEGETDLIIVAMPPIIETSQVTFTARVEPDMSVPASPLNWTLQDSAGTVLLGPVTAPGGNVALLPGDYTLSVERVNQGTSHEAVFTVDPNTPEEVIIPLPALVLDVNLIARIGDVGGLPVIDPIIWEVTPLDPAPEIAMSNPATVQLGRGAYRVTGYWTVQEIEASADFVVVDQPRDIVVVFEEPAVTAILTAPATAIIAEDVEVAWEGPNEQGDFITIRHPDSNSLLSVVNVRDEPTVTIRMPSEPGTYTIAYSQDGGNSAPIGTTTIEVLDASATLLAPDTVAIAEAFQVTWEGPGYDHDRVAIVPVGERAQASNGRALLFGNPLDLTAPAEVGQYELHYILREDARVIGTRPIEVVAVQASITTAPSAPAGSTAEIGWTGPENEGDFIGIRAPDAEGYHRFTNTTRIEDGNPLDLLMPVEPGTYVIEYVLGEGRLAIAEATIEVSPVAATVTAPASASAGETIEIGFSGPEYRNDFISVREPDAEGYHRFVNTIAVNRGNPARLDMPTEPGTYVIEYIEGQDRTALAASEIVISAVSATLTVAPTASAGDTIEIGFTGPEYDGDFISVREPDAEGYHRFVNTISVERGNPARLDMPTEPGTYVIEYIEGQDRTPLAVSEIVISAVSATLTVGPSASAGETIEVGFTGPEYDGDFISVREPDAEGYHRFINTIAAQRGNPARLEMPSEPGTYLIEYIEGQDRTALAVSEIVISAVSATITAPSNANVGDEIEIGWTGPDYDGDFIAIRRPDSEGYHRFESTVSTQRGNPVRMDVPTEPGTYIVEYVEGQDRTALAASELVVAASEASVTIPATATAGSTIEVGWTGPAADRDFIGIGLEGAEGGQRWENYTRVDQGNPVDLLVPTTPGTYLVQYFLDQDRVSLASATITVTPAEASITAPQTAVAGSTIEVGWTGPAENGDYIGIGLEGAQGGGQWENYVRVDQGNPADLLVPTTPGTYLVQYFLDQDRVSLVSTTVTVTPAEASLTAPQTAVGGSTIEIGWTGPNYNSDYIGIGLAGADGGGRWENYTRTSDGSPLQLLVPVAPGSYEIQYFIDQDRLSIATVSITVTAPEATLTAPTSAAAGSEIEVGWTGPAYRSDFIGIGPAGASGGDLWQEYARTSEGSPLTLTVPDAPGSYVIQYFVDQDRSSIASIPITVE